MIDAVSNGFGLEVGTSSQRAQVNREQFLEILVSELTHQNPLEPMDNSQFLDQLVSLQTLEETSALTDALKTFENFMQMSSAANMIGRTVKAVDDQGFPVEGIVERVTVENGNVMLQVGPHRVPYQGVQEIS